MRSYALIHRFILRKGATAWGTPRHYAAALAQQLLDLWFLDDMDSKTTPMLYRPPQATVVPVDSSKRNPFAVMQSSLTLSSNLTPTPPSFFRRLDAYIHANNLRAWDVFVAMDLNQDKRVTLEDLLDGLHQINFDLSPTEKSDLVDWMHEAVASDGLSFKEFTLALKLRSTLSPIRSKQSKSI